jgi:hypothetical protein
MALLRLVLVLTPDKVTSFVAFMLIFPACALGTSTPVATSPPIIRLPPINLTLRALRFIEPPSSLATSIIAPSTRLTN